MHAVVVLVSVAAWTVVSVPAAANQAVALDGPETECVVKHRLSFETHYVIASKPEVPADACSHDISAYSAVRAAQSHCLQGYARHSNGRCYRVVDKPQDGGAVAKHEYRVTYRADCLPRDSERIAGDLGPLEALDFCDEDGGCVDGDTEDSYHPLFNVPKECVEGWILDANGVCQETKTIRLQDRNTKPQKNKLKFD